MLRKILIFVWAQGGLLSKLHCTYSNNRLVINRNMPHKSLFQREMTCYFSLCLLINIV